MDADEETDGPAGSIPAVRAFNKELAPAYIDHACIVNGFAPPPGSPLGEATGAGFAYCELHCGSAVTATLLASCNPLGDFHAIDPRKTSLDAGRALAKDGGARNIRFHETGISGALELDLPPFDYIVVNGIYSWVALRERALILAFVRKFLKPGGAVYVSYNAKPGGSRLEPFRRIFREATRGLRLEPKQRLDAAREIYERLYAVKAPAILAAGLKPTALEEFDNMAADSLTADYANDFAEPLYVTEVASDFHAIGCALTGPADMAVSVPALVAREPFKSVMERMPTPEGRELVKDFLLDTHFRRDVFVQGGRRLAADNRDMVLNGLAFAFEQPGSAVRNQVRVAFGEIRFDNPQARNLVALLTEGPKTLGELIARARAQGAEPNDIVANVHALLLTAQIRPAYRGTPEAAEGALRMQDAVRARAGSPDGIGFLPSAFGTAFAVPVPDQIFMGLSAKQGADAMAAEACTKLNANAGAREMVARRARAYQRNARHYATLGLLKAGSA